MARRNLLKTLLFYNWTCHSAVPVPRNLKMFHPKTIQDSGLIVLASIKRCITSQRQGCLFCNQFSCIVWGLSLLVRYKMRNMEQFTTQHKDKELYLTPAINFLPIVLYVKNQWLTTFILVITILVACVDQNKFELFWIKNINVTHFI